MGNFIAFVLPVVISITLAIFSSRGIILLRSLIRANGALKTFLGYVVVIAVVSALGSLFFIIFMEIRIDEEVWMTGLFLGAIMAGCILVGPTRREAKFVEETRHLL